MNRALEIEQRYVREDNLLRWVFSSVAFVAALGLRFNGLLPDLAPLVRIYLVYNLCAGGLALLARRRTVPAWLDDVFQVFDNAAIWATAQVSGGLSSPLAILFLVPVGVEIYRRRAAKVLLNGYASCFFVGAGLVLLPREEWGAGPMVGLLHLMGMGAIAALGAWGAFQVNRAERVLNRQLRRLELLKGVQQLLFLIREPSDFKPALESAAARLSEAFDEPCCAPRLWFRSEESGLLEPVGFQAQPCETGACSALRSQCPWTGSGSPCGAGMELHPGTTRACVPILDEGHPLGLIQAACSSGFAAETADISYLESLAAVILRAAQAVRSRRSLERNMQAVRKSYEMDSIFIELFLRPSTGAEETISGALAGAARTLGVDVVNLLIWDDSAQRLWVRAASGHTPAAPHRFFRLGEGLAGRCLLTGMPHSTEDVDKDADFVTGSQEMRSLLCVPLLTPRGERLGVLCAQTTAGPRVFDEQDSRILMLFGRYVAHAIEGGRMEESLERQRARLNELNDLRARFLSIASHDLRAPLQVALTYTRVLVEKEFGEVNPTQEDLLLKVLKVLREQQSLIDNLLDIAQVEGKKLAVDRRPMDMEPVFKDVSDNMGQMARAAKLLFSSRCEAGVWVNGDELRLRQVLVNLLQNAFKFTPEGGEIEMRLELEGVQAHLSVRDTGAGIPKEELQRIFQNLYQLPVAKARDRGLGLGLAICKEIVEAHEGRIWAESRGRGEGAVFHVLLPAVTPVLHPLGRAR